MADKKSNKIACVHCGEFFKIIPGEADEFIDLYADRDFLKSKKFPFPKELRDIYKTRRRYIATLLEVYCPYCRSAEFSFPHHPKFPKCTDAKEDKPRVTDDEYLEMTEQEMRKMGGFHFGVIVDKT